MNDTAGLPETTENFLVWPGDGRTRHHELVDGVVRAMPPRSTTHGTIQSNIAFLIGSRLKSGPSPCRLIIMPGVVPRLNAGRNVRIADLGVTCVPDRARQAAIEDPILLVQILSPANKAATWTNIWAYSTIPGLHEILIVQSTRIDVQILRSLPDRGWPDRPLSLGADQELTLDSVGLTCPVAAIYADTHLLADLRA